MYIYIYIYCFATAPKGTWETIIVTVIILKCQEKYSLAQIDNKTNIKKKES